MSMLRAGNNVLMKHPNASLYRYEVDKPVYSIDVIYGLEILYKHDLQFVYIIYFIFYFLSCSKTDVIIMIDIFQKGQAIY